MKVWSVAGCVLLSACSTQPVVHVFHASLDDTQQQRLVSQLEQANIHYVLNDLPVPPEYNSDGDTVRLNRFPADQNAALISQLSEVVNALGYAGLDVQDFNGEFHRFSEGNYGLYFPGVMTSVSLPEVVHSHDCEMDAFQIELKTSGDWILTGTATQGQWQYNAPYLTLIWNDGRGAMQQAYQMTSHTVKTMFGEKPALTYQVMGHRSYAAIPIFNCDLQVIYAE
ncbi:hypothetical protein PRUB_a3125 [Pseudoalteromonas rubra]|uniref:Uncharacterized protein n=1 Tax=Pseudoalteromonas rubra TaxID=43658 RepID=A0A8T0CCN3_9GAMM|nr:hypothetical protein [Pseudoalteromonas rubra]KAF7788456.1 hypothetical protein PRUB_a3125 [Pseudoalteromonas rubra]